MYSTNIITNFVPDNPLEVHKKRNYLVADFNSKSQNSTKCTIIIFAYKKMHVDRLEEI